VSKTKNRYNQKSIYVPDKYMDFYDKLSEEAEEDGRGVGSYLCRELMRYREIENSGIVLDSIGPEIRIIKEK
jgi:hypothetical protein